MPAGCKSLPRLAGPALVALVAAAMVAWTWRTWPDLLIDFGRDLYLAWRITEGEVLYRDLGHFNGPLSPHLNAAWLALFGEGIQRLVLLNCLVGTATAALLYALLTRIADRVAATVALLVFATLFATIQLVPVANYNFLTPYSHEMTHGLALSLLGLWSIWRHRVSGRRRWVAVAGAALGLAFLTKVEIFVAGAAGTGLALLFAIRDRIRSAGFSAGAGLGLTFLAAAAAPVAAAWLALLTQMSAEDAARGTLGAWNHVFNREALSLDFYRRGMGTLSPLQSVASMRDGFGVYLAVIAAALALSQLLGYLRFWPPLLAALAFALVGGAVWFGLERNTLWAVGRPLPVALVSIGLALAIWWWRTPRDHPERARLELALSFCAFALVLLGKMILNVRISHYGFVLALPATALTIVALMTWLPRLAAGTPAKRLVWRAGLLGAITAVAVLHLQVAASWRETRTVAIGAGADRILVAPRSARLFADVAAALEARLPPQGTFAVLPQGAMLNYLLRRANPTGFVQLLPPDVLFFDEQRVLAAFQTRPPDAIVFISMDTSSFGVGQFGEGYARDLWQWVESHYRFASKLGEGRLSARLLLPVSPD